MNPEERKKRVLRSKAFATWWEARKEVDPVPSNPYQAFMIDQSLHAIVDNRPNWEKDPNGRDLPSIDLPFSGVPTYAPARKPRRRHDAPEKSPELPKDPKVREAILFAEQMALAHGQPAPLFVALHREGPLQSSANVGLGRFAVTGPLIRAGGGKIRIGTGGKSRVQRLATTAHEVGHVVHAQSLFKIGKPLEGIPPYEGFMPSYSDERSATKLARKQLKKTLKPKGEYPAASWFLGYALDTYRRGFERRGKPVKVDQHGNLVKG